MKLYSTKQVSEHSGASLRQLQWWDERGILAPNSQGLDGNQWGSGHPRMYTEAQLRIAWYIIRLRRKRVSMRAIRALMPVIKNAVAGSLWVIRNGRRIQVTNNEKLVPHLAEQLGAVEKLEVKL